MGPTFARLWAVTLIVLLAWPARAEAVDFRNGAAITVGAGEIIEDDLYASGSDIVITGTVNGDVAAFGGSVLVDGTINGSLAAIAGNVTISRTGVVRDSVRVGAGQVVIAGSVGRDLLLGAGNVEIQPSARVARDAYFGIGSGNIGGAVGRDVRLAGGQISLNATVGRAAELLADTVIVGTDAQVAGEFRYRGERSVQISPNAKLTGAVTELPPVEQRRQPSGGEVFLGTLWDRLRGLVTPLALGLLGLWLLPRSTEGIVGTVGRRPLLSAGVGVGFLIMAPILGVMLAVVGLLTGGFSLGLLLVTASWVLIVLSRAVIGLALGEALLRRFQPDRAEQNRLALLLGLGALALLSLLPVVDLVLNIMVAVLGSGAVVLWVAETHRKFAQTEASPI